MNTLPAVHTVLAVIHDLHPGELGFRIGAPFAAKGTALQENRGPDAGTVVDRKLLNVKNGTFHIMNSLSEHVRTYSERVMPALNESYLL